MKIISSTSNSLIFILFYYTHYYAVVGFDVVSAFNRHEIVSNYSRARITQHNKSCNSPIQTPPPATIILHSSPLDDFLDNIFGNDDNNKKNSDDSSTNNEDNNNNRLDKDENEEENENNMSLSSFQQELAKRQTNIEAPTDDDNQQQQQQQQQLESPNSDSSSSVQIEAQQQQQQEEEEEFDGYDLRDIIQAKYGVCYDVEFQRVDVGGFRSVYLVRISCTCLFVSYIYLHAA